MPLDAAVQKRLADWRDKLIDLTRSNRLLNYRPHSASSVRVVEEDPREIADLLMSGKTLVFDPKPEEDETHEERPAGTLRTGDLRLQTSLKRERLHKVLTRLYREAKASIEEQGFNTLYLGLGMLSFATPDDPRGFHAPVLLLPVELKRRGARSDFRLHIYDDEPIVNPALVVKLRQDHGIELSLPDEEETLTYEVLLQAFEPARKRLEGALQDEIHLGLFSFAKIPLYNDLLAHGETIGAHRIAGALASGRALAVEGDPALAAPKDVDAAIHGGPTFQILDADSSQQAAILSARAGRSFVLQGPPGTGKSQTIANIISEALAADRTVLFVSEKMAALEVVQRRLADAGLGAFCLELHSRKANKREVVQSLARAWAQASEAAGKEEGALAELRELRELLAAYVGALHEARGESGYTAFEVLGHAARYRGIPECPFPIDKPLDVPRRTLKDIEQRLRTLTPLLAAVEPTSAHPWHSVRRHSIGVSTLDDARKGLNLLLGALDAQSAAHEGLASVLGQEAPRTPAEAEQLSTFAALLLETTKPSEAWLGEAEWAGLSPRVKRAVAQGQELESLRKELLGRYQAGVLDLDASELERRARPGGFIAGWWRRRGVRGLLKSLRTAASPGLAADVAALVRVRTLRSEVEGADAALLQAFGNAYEGPSGSFAGLAAHQGWIESLRAAWPPAVNVTAELLSLAKGGDHTALREARAALASAATDLAQRRAQLIETLELEAEAAWPGGAEHIPLGDQREQAELWIERVNDLPAWITWEGAQGAARAEGLGAYLDAFAANALDSRVLLDAWFRTWFRAAADELLETVDVLRAFDGRTHDTHVDRFRSLDRAQIDAARRRVAARLRAAVPDPNVRQVGDSEVGILKREIGKQRMHLPTRILLERIPHLVRLLKPCLMMSPLSVATYLPPGKRSFDLVVFDEASQICTEDGVGAIARGEQVIVCGDSQQLPPTRFFERRIEEGEEAPEDILVDLPSILDECKAGPLPQIPLMWHYRSRDESLINFSNRHFYDDTLVTFPNAARDDAELGISFEHVSEGVYYPGGKGTRSNPVEAAAVADRVFEILEQRPADSVGVVTFSTTQRDEVMDALDARRRDGDPHAERFDAEADEPVFVKNLEAVQGDERDVILFSIGYGRDPEGTLRLNFGPLNKEGGDKRLNVAVTRARKQVVVFSSIQPEDIDTERAKGRGSRLLRAYLESAKRGMGPVGTMAAGDEVSEPAADAGLPALLQSIRRELAAHGFDADARVGNSEFKIDLAVRDPDQPGRYLLAILCDGPGYAGAATARDRDRTRAEALERLGWHVHRVWSPDWVRAPGREIERIASSVDKARSGERPEPPPAPAKVEEQEGEISFDENALVELKGVVPYRVANLRLRGPAAEYHAVPLSRLTSALMKVVEKEGPLHEELAARRLAVAWGITRATSKVLERFEEAATALAGEGRIHRREGFLSLPDTEIVVRGPADGVQRDAEQVPPEELRACALLVVDAYLGLPQDSLLREMGRALGFKRLSEKLTTAWTPVVAALLSEGVLEQEGESIRRAQAPDEETHDEETHDEETHDEETHEEETPDGEQPDAGHSAEEASEESPADTADQ